MLIIHDKDTYYSSLACTKPHLMTGDWMKSQVVWTDKANNPLTAAFQMIKHLAAGRYCYQEANTPEVMARYSLSPEEFDELNRCIAKDRALWGWVGDIMNFDYNEPLSQFTLQRRTSLHSTIYSQVHSEIRSQLNDFAASTSIAKLSNLFAKEVHFFGASTIKLPFFGHGQIQRTPCDQFGLLTTLFPGIVLGVGSQGPSEIHRRAKQYIFGSNGEIQKVIYEEDIQCIATVDNQPFINSAGQPNPKTEIRLALSDFSHREETSKFGGLGEVISISATKLQEVLEMAIEYNHNFEMGF